MRVLVTWSSKRGGTAGLGEMIAETFRARGLEVQAAPVERVQSLAGFDAVVLGGALYANRWPASGGRFVTRHLRELRKIPVWLFSSGPLDDSADRQALPPAPEISVFAGRIGAQGHATFGGRLTPDAKGFAARAMAKTHSGDWRNPERVRAWAMEVADVLPSAHSGAVSELPAHALSRLIEHGTLGWVLGALMLVALVSAAAPGIALALHAVLIALIYAGVASHYFGSPGARSPLLTSLVWTALAALLDGIIFGWFAQAGWALYGGIARTWIPLALIFVVTLIVGSLRAMMPVPTKPAEDTSRRPQPPVAAGGH